MIDEISYPALHQWLSTCRLLMRYHPRQGAEAASMVLGQSDRYRPGWNRVWQGSSAIHPELFVLVESGSGLTTPTLPTDVDPEKVHTVPDVPNLEFTHAWQLAQALAGQVVDLRLSEFPKHKVEQVMQTILLASKSDLYNVDKASLRKFVLAALTRMETAMNGTLNGKLLMDDFVGPVLDLIDAYLSFQIPGMVAAPLIAGLLSMQCNLPSLGPPALTPPPARKAAINHFVKVTQRMIQEREKLNVGAYYTLTYLAGLYSRAATALVSDALEVGDLTPEEQIELERIALNVDEQAAYSVSPAFTLPALFSSAQTVEWLKNRSSIRGASRGELSREHCVHPGLRAILENPIFELSNAEQVVQAYQAESASRAHMDVVETVRGQFGPIAPENRERILRGLVSLAIGYRMGEHSADDNSSGSRNE